MRKYHAPRPARHQLQGLSASELKTLLKRSGHQITRDFYGRGSTTRWGGRRFRFRWWGDSYDNSHEFLVDVSCPVADFDRWANSVTQTLTFAEWYEKFIRRYT
jgi:hypothetical protein